MSSRKKSRRARSRRHTSHTPAGAPDQEAPVGTETPKKRKSRGTSISEPGTRADRARRRPASAAELDHAGRPQAPWHPLPLSETLILIGGIGLVIGVIRGVAHGGGPPAVAGLAAVGLGAIEVAWREHNGGFRSHTVLLSLLPLVLLHSLVLVVTAQFVTPPRLLEVGMLGVDLVLFVVLFRFMRARFANARRSRIFSGQSRAR